MIVRHIAPYTAIAALCAALNYAILVGGDRLGMHYSVSTALSFAVCVVVGYVLHSRYTYAASRNAGSFVRYVAVMALNYPLAVAALWLFHDILGLPMTIAAAATTVLSPAYNYLSSRWAIVRRVTAH